MRLRLGRDHERLDRLFAKLLEEFREGDARDLRAMWTRFEAGLSAHLNVEERDLLPLFIRSEPAETARLLIDHRDFRRMLDELGVGVDLHLVSLDVALGFVEALRAHARREDQLLYRWADRWVDASGQEAVARKLGVKRTRFGAVSGTSPSSVRR